MKLQPGSPALCQLICDRMARSPQQRIPFAEFMELALYHPQHGYYAASSAQLGHTGDFVTSSHLDNDFGELLAAQLAEMWHQLNYPHPFQLVEMGPGQGHLAETILSYLQRQHPDCLAATHYILIETSPALKTEQQTRLQPWQAQGVSLNWCALTDLPQDSVTGCFFSNELVDAFPVHRVMLTDTGLQEQYVTPSTQGQPLFEAVVGPLSTPALADYFDPLGIRWDSPPYPVGFTTEVNLAALTWMKDVAQKLHQGYVLTIDYGYTAERYYSPTRSQGTLQCYYRQAYHNDPFVNVGQQDITAHVDFTALARQGQHSGLETLGSTPQGLFLMALGLGDRLNELSQLQGTDGATITYAIRRREALHQLINPMGLGNFTVLLQGKGLTAATQKHLRGLATPDTGI
ncbi:MAG: class I SAM-dependent methyltransferase [Leptolyngbya sp. SIO1E4]|nr:class I SAM-dependent methyltransferase [Leptolyngbya sp. SIO1E4]